MAKANLEHLLAGVDLEAIMEGQVGHRCHMFLFLLAEPPRLQRKFGEASWLVFPKWSEGCFQRKSIGCANDTLGGYEKISA